MITYDIIVHMFIWLSFSFFLFYATVLVKIKMNIFVTGEDRNIYVHVAASGRTAVYSFFLFLPVRRACMVSASTRLFIRRLHCSPGLHNCVCLLVGLSCNQHAVK